MLIGKKLRFYIDQDMNFIQIQLPSILSINMMPLNGFLWIANHIYYELFIETNKILKTKGEVL